MSEYLTLFVTALVSATLLPMGSEGALLYLLSEGGAVLPLIVVASVGNTLGALINYWLGLKGADYITRRGYVSQKRADQAHGYFERYGGYALLFSWMPVVGDPLTFIAGAARYSWVYFLVIVAAAKTGRYLFVAAGYFYFN